MSVAVPPTYDKNIVERRRVSRNADLTRTLRAARERLTSNSGLAPRFDRELLVQHALALKGAAIAMPLPVLVAGFVLSIFVGTVHAVIWSLLALAGYLGLLWVARRFDLASRGKWQPGSWGRAFLLGHVLAATSWAALAAMRCDACGPLTFELFQFSILLIIIAVTAMVSSTLKNVVLLAFLPLIVVLAMQIATDPEPLLVAMRAMLIGAIPFFSAVSEQLRRNAVERMKHQEEKDELIAELETARTISEEARRRAEEANLAKSRFLATMSHELRTPLNAILGFSDVMTNEILGPVGNPTYREYIGDIHASGQHLLDLINEILDLSRVEAGRYTLNEEAVSLPAVASDCVSYVQLKAKAKSISILSRFETELPQLWADERSLRQVILNLLSNAVKFTPSGGEIVIRVGWTAGGGQYVSVRDNGPGIPAEEIPVVLSSFGQGSIAIKSAEQGTGLGLPIVQALVHLHDGQFTLTSKLREGTEAIATFPNSRVLEVMPPLAEELTRIRRRA